MRYLCIVHVDYGLFRSMSKEEVVELEKNNLAYDAELVERGQLLAGHGLEPPESGVVIKVRNGEMSMSDGPFSEAKEQMAGFLLVEARDMNEAIAIAAGIPLAKGGQIEIRPVYAVPGQA
jgi:hypothetical protein